LLVALAAGDFDLSKKIAVKMGGRIQIEKRHDHSFDRNIGYALKWLVMEDCEQLAKANEAFVAACSGKSLQHDLPCARFVVAVAYKDSQQIKNSMPDYLAWHTRLARNGRFKNTAQEFISIWGLGLLNFVRNYGVQVAGDGEMIPNTLLFSPN
jgi:hypothetical protein